MQGIVQLVTVRPGGGFPTSPSAVGSSSLSFADASDFEEGGGQVSIDGVVLDYVSADLELDVVYLASPLSFAVDEETFVANHPPTTETFASVALDDDIVEAEVPHSLKPLLPEGPRDPEDGEAVILEMDEQGFWSIADVVGSRAAIDAVFIDNADELLLADMKTLGEKLSDAAAERAAAAGRLDAAEGLLGDAFDQIDVLPDQAYVDAAKQQAIDAAAIDAQDKADAAEDAAVEAAAVALQAAEQELADAIATGDQAAISAAQTKADAARDAAIAAAATDATTKANAARDAAIAAAASDATAKAAEAMTKATAALTAAQSAQATADNAIRTYYSANPPWANGSTQPDDVLGDMWFDLDDGQAYRWSGTSWIVIRDQGIGQALAAAQSAQTTADGKITAFYQPNEPLEADEGDLWFDTDNGNLVHRRVGSTWVSVADARIAAQASALVDLQGDLTGLEGKVDGKAVIHYQTTAPTDLTEADKGDIWIDSDASPKTFKSWSGSAWVDVTDQTAIDALAKVQTKTTTYQTETTTAPTAPAGGFTAGDLWVDSNGKIARWSGSGWVTAVDPKALADSAKWYADEQISKRTNLVDNPSRTGEVGRWVRGWGNGGTSPVVVQRSLEGTTIPVLEAFTTGENWILSSWENQGFQIDPTKAYQISVWLEDEKALAAPGIYGSDQILLGITTMAADKTTLTKLTPVVSATGVAGAAQNGSFFALHAASTAPIGGFRRYVAYIMPTGTDPATMRDLGVNVRSNVIMGPDTAIGSLRVVNYNVQNTPGGKKVWIAHPTVVEVDPLAVTGRFQAVQDAKAYVTTQVDGVAKSVWSTALPGTTRLPQNSTWYQHDSAGKIIAVFNQTAASSGTTHGNTWVARPIKSEAIDSLDLGKLSVAGSATMQQAVIDSLVAQTAAFVKADIGNLTVTGASNLNTVVAERIWGNIATFAQITADQILSGSLQATISVVAGGIIVAGDPTKAAVELTADGITIWDWTEEDGRFQTTRLGGAGADSLEITDAAGHVVAGFSAEGSVTAQTAAITNDITVGGRPFLGRLGPNPPTSEDAETSWLEETPRGVVAWRDFQDRVPSTGGRATNEEWGYAAIETDVIAGRLYRITVIVYAVSYVTGGVVRWRLRASQGSPAKTDSLLLHADESPPAVSQTYALYGQVTGYWAPTTDGVLSTLITYTGREGATPQMRYATFTVEDIGLAGDPASGGYSTGGAVAGTGGTQPPPTAPPPVKKTYTSTWEASGFQAYYGNGSARSSSGELVQGYTSYYSAGGINTSLVNFNGNAISGETGKAMGAALIGATVTKVEIRLRNVHWHSSQGGRVQLMKKTGSSLPETHPASSFTAGKTYPSSGYWARGAAMWVTVPTDWFSATNRMFAIGANNTSSTYYGRFVGTGSERPRVRITYTR